jgi:monofunctional chorismate mutase
MKNLREQIDIIDESMLNLFLERMQIVKQVAEYKKENRLPVLDKNRELEIIKKNVDRVDNLDVVDLYEEFFTKTIEISKKYQERIIGE